MPVTNRYLFTNAFNKFATTRAANYTDYIEPFSSFIINKSDDNAILLSIYYKQQKLCGDLHIDAPLLAGVEAIVNYLKHSKLVKNLESIVYSAENLPYHGVKLNYNPELCGIDRVPQIEPIGLISKVILYKESFKIEAKSEQSVDFIQQLETLLHQLGLSNKLDKRFVCKL